VYRHAGFGDDVHVGAADPPVLLVGRGTLEQSDRAILAFRFGQAFTYLWPGRALACGLPPTELKQLLLALVTLGAPGVQVEDPTGEIAALHDRLAAANGALANEIAPLVERLLKDRATLNLTRYMRGLLRTAERVGLLACNDLSLAARIVA